MKKMWYFSFEKFVYPIYTFGIVVRITFSWNLKHIFCRIENLSFSFWETCALIINLKCIIPNKYLSHHIIHFHIFTPWFSVNLQYNIGQGTTMMSVSSNFFFSVLVLRKKWLSKFSSNLHVLRPPESEKTVFTKVSVCLFVCLSVCNRSYTR